MSLLVLSVQFSPVAGVLLIPDKQRQIILVDPLILIIVIIPDKAAVPPVLRDRLLSEYLPVLIICVKIKRKGITYGFGGIASIGKGLLPAEHIIKEHYRLGSELVILSRSFCNASLISDLDEIREVFTNGVRELRMYEQEVQKAWEYFGENQKEIVRIVKEIIGDKE